MKEQAKHEPLRIYVAGASRERHERALPAIERIRGLGMFVTHDWNAAMTGETVPEQDAKVSDDVRRHHSELDCNGVRQADFVLLLAPNERGSSGVWVELGLAIAFRVPVLVCGKHNRRTIFTALAHRLFDSDAEGIAYLRAVQEERG